LFPQLYKKLTLSHHYRSHRQPDVVVFAVGNSFMRGFMFAVHLSRYVAKRAIVSSYDIACVARRKFFNPVL